MSTSTDDGSASDNGAMNVETGITNGWSSPADTTVGSDERKIENTDANSIEVASETDGTSIELPSTNNTPIRKHGCFTLPSVDVVKWKNILEIFYYNNVSEEDPNENVDWDGKSGDKLVIHYNNNKAEKLVNLTITLFSNGTLMIQGNSYSLDMWYANHYPSLDELYSTPPTIDDNTCSIIMVPTRGSEDSNQTDDDDISEQSSNSSVHDDGTAKITKDLTTNNNSSPLLINQQEVQDENEDSEVTICTSLFNDDNCSTLTIPGDEDDKVNEHCLQLKSMEEEQLQESPTSITRQEHTATKTNDTITPPPENNNINNHTTNETVIKQDLTIPEVQMNKSVDDTGLQRDVNKYHPASPLGKRPDKTRSNRNEKDSIFNQRITNVESSAENIELVLLKHIKRFEETFRTMSKLN